jgi:hypothetical protein
MSNLERSPAQGPPGTVQVGLREYQILLDAVDYNRKQVSCAQAYIVTLRKWAARWKASARFWRRLALEEPE